MCEPYHGWANRETWALYLWLSNDYAMYNTARTIVEGGDIRDAARILEEWVDEVWWEQAATHDGRNMIFDVGSLWRIDWREVAEAFRE